MELESIKYSQYKLMIPDEGQHIVGQERDNTIVVYQAYNNQIADYAVKNQHLGGDFKLARMSWIKTNFLWMMYRSGWATKENQENILAITIPKDKFRLILKEAVHSSYIESIYGTKETWSYKLKKSEVRLQWDPDHDPFGNPLKRKAIQIGLSGSILKKYSHEWIISIQDLTPFVNEQRQKLKLDYNNLEVIKESIILDLF